jgi:hypothetical protein
MQHRKHGMKWKILRCLRASDVQSESRKQRKSRSKDKAGS